MNKQQQMLQLIVGLLGIAAVVSGFFGFGRMGGFWRLVHIAGGAVMIWSVLPVLKQFFRSLTKK